MKTISTTLPISPRPKYSTAMGMKAIGGIGRMNAMMGDIMAPTALW
ncbi:Uncharacterised protein [Bordetella pertussis]|nr:Uncharacterised protein [Bordetella pertussis]